MWHLKTLLFIALWMLQVIHADAQKIYLSEREPISLRSDDFMVIGKCNRGIAVYVNHLSEAKLIFYNKQMIAQKAIPLSFLPSDISNIFFTPHPDGMQVFYVIKQQKQLNVFMASLREDDTWTEPLLIDSSPLTLLRNQNEYHFLSSEDNRYTLVYVLQEQTEGSLLKAFVLDPKGITVTRIEQAFQQPGLRILRSGAVDNKGQIFLLLTDNKSSRSSVETLALLHSESGSSVLQSTPVNLRDHSLSDVQLVLDNTHDHIYLVSYYADGRSSWPRGLYMSSYSTEGMVEGGTFFTPLTLQESTSKADLRDLRIRHVFVRKDGGIEVVAEKTYQSTRSIGGAAPMISTSFMTGISEPLRTVQEYSYDEIVLFNVKSDGSMAWSQTILKDQTTLDDNGIYSSFGVLQHPMGHAFIFSDLTFRQNRLLVSYVSGNGEMAVKELQTTQEADKWNLMPRSAIQVSKSEIVMPCVTKNYLCFLNISY
jgi:hypothetical protein